MKYITWLDRLKLLFTKKQYVWDHDVGVLTVFKARKGAIYVLAQELIQHGDMRNRQLDRWGL